MLLFSKVLKVKQLYFLFNYYLNENIAKIDIKQ